MPTNYCMTRQYNNQMKRTISVNMEIQRTTPINLSEYEYSLYKQMTGMLVQATKTACFHSGYSFEELKPHADFLFVKALRTFDESRNTKFSTFLYTILHNGLIDYGTALRRHEDWSTRVFVSYSYGQDSEPLSFEMDSIVDPTSIGNYRFVEDYVSLSDDAKILADLALLGMGSDLQKIERLALSRLGYTYDRFVAAVLEIREMVDSWI